MIPLITIILGVSIFSIMMVSLIIGFFGKIIKLQIRTWILSKRGYLLIEHINGYVRNYYLLKAKNNKFVFKNGIYAFEPSLITRTTSLLYKTGVFKRVNSEKEINRLKEMINKLVVDDKKVSYDWGIPMLTFVGDGPYPVDFVNPENFNPAKPIREFFANIVYVKRTAYIKRIITICLIVAVIALALGFLLFFNYQNSNALANQCLFLWNSSQERLLSCMNYSVSVVANGTMVV